ncbi:MAG: fumarylacetoacetate hydrolase family protein [Anaerolineae bacterium]
MYLLTFQTESGLRLGVKTPAGVVDVAAASAALGAEAGNAPQTLQALLTGGEAALAALSDFVGKALAAGERAPWLLQEAGLRLGPCLPDPGKILCVGINYRAHAAEAGRTPPEAPVLFSKFNNALAAPNEPIPLPRNAEKYDHEVELAAVIGRRARYVGQNEALAYVFGYCTANDISARDLQRRTSQWLLGKTLDKFFPIGPYLVTADEVADPQALDLRCWVNGDLRQNANTGEMIFSVAQIISYASQYMTLEPGDVISTGTPEGVILGRQEQDWLKPGDEVSAEVAGLGRLTNVMVRG